MAIKNDQKGICWIDWPEELKDRHSKAVKEAEKELEEEIDFYRFQQYCFTTQWRKLKSICQRERYSASSAMYRSMWHWTAQMHGQIRRCSSLMKITIRIAVAGCPPDAFSATGQLWGNPLYDWKKLKEDRI